MTGRRTWLWLVLTWGALAADGAGAQEVAETVVRSGTTPDDVYAAGARVYVVGDVGGDVVVAGGRVVVGQQVGGDVLAAGGMVEVRARVLDDVRLAGGEITLDGKVAGDAMAAGGRVRITPDAQIGGRAWLAGAEVDVGGHLERGLAAAAGHVRISGRIDGDVRLRAGDIEILPAARIGGDLVYESAQPAHIVPGARIAGRVQHIPVAHGGRAPRVMSLLGGLAAFAGLLVAGMALVLLFPDFSGRAARAVLTEPWKSLALGLALLVTVPVAALILVVTVVGTPLGLSVLALYPVALLAGFLLALVALGDAGLRFVGRGAGARRGWRLLGLALAMTILALLQLVPFLGGFIGFVVLLSGLGALGLGVGRQYRREDARVVS